MKSEVVRRNDIELVIGILLVVYAVAVAIAYWYMFARFGWFWSTRHLIAILLALLVGGFHVVVGSGKMPSSRWSTLSCWFAAGGLIEIGLENIVTASRASYILERDLYSYVLIASYPSLILFGLLIFALVFIAVHVGVSRKEQ